MVRGAVPTAAELRSSCDAEVGYLRAQCYRAVLELELRARGVPARTAVGSVKHMERLGFGAYAAKALARLERSGVLPPPDSGSAATLEAGLPWEGGASGAAEGAGGLAQPGPQQAEQHQAKEEEEQHQAKWEAGKGKGKAPVAAPAVPHELSRSYEPELGEWKRFIAFYALRLCLAPLLESIILIGAQFRHMNCPLPMSGPYLAEKSPWLSTQGRGFVGVQIGCSSCRRRRSSAATASRRRRCSRSLSRPSRRATLCWLRGAGRSNAA